MAFGNQNQIKNSILRTSRYGSFLYMLAGLEIRASLFRILSILYFAGCLG